MSSDQILGIMEQLVLLSAFLGGFSATFLAAIVAVDSQKSVGGWLVVSSAAAACCFIVCAASSVAAVNGIQTGLVDAEDGFGALKWIRLTSALSMALGMLSLLASIGLSGWLKDRRTGAITTTMAVAAMLIVGVLI